MDHWWYLVGRNDLPNHSFCGYFHGTGAQVAQTDWYPWGPWMQFSIGCCGHHCCWQLGTLHWFHESMNPNGVSLDTGASLHIDCAEWQNSDLLCGADWTFYVVQTELTHLHRVTLLRGAFYSLFYPSLPWAVIGELQQPWHNCSKMSLSPCCGCFCEFSQVIRLSAFLIILEPTMRGTVSE